MDSLFEDEDYTYIDIVLSKYINMNLSVLRDLCREYEIEISPFDNRKDIALSTIPKALCDEYFLKNFYHTLESKEKKILKFIVNYSGSDLDRVVKKKFQYEIVAAYKKSIPTYVWWLELFIDNNDFDPTLREYFLEFLSDDKKSKKKRAATVEKNIELIERAKDIESITVDKVHISGESFPQKLINIDPKESLLAIRVLYVLCSEAKIKVTLKGTLTVKSNKLITENMPSSFDYIWLLNFLAMNGYITSQQVRMPTSKFILLSTKSDADIIKTLFYDFTHSEEMYELALAMFHVNIVSGYGVEQIRKMILDIIKAEDAKLWISVDYIVNKIKLDAKTLMYITNGYHYCYGFYGNSNRIRYNNIEHLKVVVRYFIKAFMGFMNIFGLCSLGTTKYQVFNKQDIRIIQNEELKLYANVEFFKLSDLGLFALGLESNFKNPDDYKLTLNPYTLEIKVENDNNLSDIFLQNIATKVDDSKYKTDIKTFMQNIDSQVRYENTKKSFLQKFDETPKNWKEFFMLLEERSKGASVVSQNTVLIKLQNDKELLKFIASHEKLKSKILKADNLHIVVLKENLSYVKKTLKEYGVII